MHWIIWSWIVKKFYDTIHNEKQREDGRETQHGVLYCNIRTHYVMSLKRRTLLHQLIGRSIANRYQSNKAGSFGAWSHRRSFVVHAASAIRKSLFSLPSLTTATGRSGLSVFIRWFCTFRIALTVTLCAGYNSSSFTIIITTGAYY